MAIEDGTIEHLHVAPCALRVELKGHAVATVPERIGAHPEGIMLEGIMLEAIDVTLEVGYTQPSRPVESWQKAPM